MRKPLRLAVAIAAALAALAVAPAAVARTCSGTTVGTLTVSMASPETGRLFVSSGALRYEYGIPATTIGCMYVVNKQFSAATTANTDTINVVGQSGSQFFALDLGGGPFAPGQTAESTGTSEIEFSIDLGADSDRLIVYGTAGNDVVAFGNALTLGGFEPRFALNDDGDAEGTVLGSEQRELRGYGGADRLTGAAGYGTGTFASGAVLYVNGGTGNDVLTGGSSLDELHGAENDDVLRGGGDKDDLLGEDGNDRYVSPSPDGADKMWIGPGTDTMDYRGRANKVVVTLSNSTADDGESGEGDNVAAEDVYGGNAGDELTGSGGPNRLYGGPGNDKVLGGDGDDTLTGGAGDDTLIGEAGSDTFLTPTLDGGDAMYGGSPSVFEPSTDTLDYRGRTAGIFVGFNYQPDDGDWSAGEADNVSPAFADIERVYFGSGNDSFYGSPYQLTTLVGGAGDDMFQVFNGNGVVNADGGAGRDLGDYSDVTGDFAGGSGDDFFYDDVSRDATKNTFRGGTGIDTARYRRPGVALELSLNGLADDGIPGEQDNIGPDGDVENLDVGSPDNVASKLTGNGLNNFLGGTLEADTIAGLGGNDVLRGRGGSDGLDGGFGADTADYQGAPVGVTADLSAGTSSGGAGADTLTAMERLTGSEFADVLVGSAASNVLRGLEGNDTIRADAADDSLFGDEGNDVLEGGLGPDSLDGGADSDSAEYGAAAAAVTVDLAAGNASGGDGADSLLGVENANGSAFADTLTGGPGPNTLLGRGGSDTLTGAAGKDELNGGPEDDALFARDGEVDQVNGGPGTGDQAQVDSGMDVVTAVELLLA